MQKNGGRRGRLRMQRALFSPGTAVEYMIHCVREKEKGTDIG